VKGVRVEADEPVESERAAGEPKPGFREIAETLRLELTAREWDPTEKLPTERALAKRFGVAPTTVRKAMGELRAWGLVDSRRGSGVYVRSWQPILRDATRRLSVTQWGSGQSIWSADLGKRRAVPDHIEITREVAPAWVAELLGTPDVVVRFRRYVVEGRPVQTARSYLPAELVAGTAIEHPDTGPGGTYARLRDLGEEPVRFSERVRSRLADPDDQVLLEVGHGHPVAAITRVAYTAAERIVEVNSMVLDGEAYILQWDFTS
jgi:GntR family transcriptional regulator